VEHRSHLVFLFLILTQGAHSIEEYVTKLYEVFTPARFVSSLVSNDLALLRCYCYSLRGWRFSRRPAVGPPTLKGTVLTVAHRAGDLLRDFRAWTFARGL
jgi:hypothetical protein